MQWLVRADGHQLGPLSHEDLLSWAKAGRLKAVDFVWREGMETWLPAGQIPDLAPLLWSSFPAGPTSLSNDALTRALLPVGRSGWAIAAGYLGIFSLLVLPAPFAVITGVLAIRAIRRDSSKHGMGRAVFGIIMGGLGTVAPLAMLVESIFS
jgi:hypothetical protein